MLRLDLDYDKEFCDLYNHFNNSESGKKYLCLLGISRDKLDPVAMSKIYFNDSVDLDKTVDVNANIGRAKSPNNYNAEMFKGIGKLNSIYLLWKKIKKLYGPEKANDCIEALINGELYCHDLSTTGIQTCYCYAWPSNHVFSGRPYGQLKSKPPKRSDSFIACVVESIFDLSTSLQGAIACPDIFVNLSYFYKNESIDPGACKDRHKIENDLQRLVHSLNQQFRLSQQSAFTNFSVMDRPTLKETFKDYRYPDGSEVDIEYVQKIQEIFVEFMAKKDPSTNLPYRFPVTTANICTSEKNEILDKEFLNMVCAYNTEGIFNIFICKGKAKLASCCRLISDPQQLMEYSRFDSFANAGLSLGSARVGTINLARIGRQSKNKEDFYSILKTRIDKIVRILFAQRKIVEKRIQGGFLRFFDVGWMNMKHFFSTVGINGLYECLQFMGYDIKTKEGLTITKDILQFIEKELDKHARQKNIPLNCEQVPAEGAASMLAKMDKVYFNDDNYPFDIYGNQFIPLWINCDLMERAKIDGQICKYMSGGSICHLNIGCKATPNQMEDLIKYAVKCGLEHFALNASFNTCENEHVSLGKSTQTQCPKCGGKITSNMTRVVGYFTSVENWDKARRERDFPNRKFNYFVEEQKNVA